MADRRVIRLPAGRFTYLECGRGTPVVFLHALGRSADDWLAVMNAIEGTWRCIALDQRGHGDSVRPGEYSFERLESDLRSFVDSLGLDRFALISHSMGATVGWLFAEKTPERLLALIIEDTPVPTSRHEYAELPPQPPESVTYDWEVRRQLFRQLNSPDPSWWSNLGKVTTPTLMIAGSPDDELEEMARVLPRAELITIEVGHWIHETAPDRFVGPIRSFLSRFTP